MEQIQQAVEMHNIKKTFGKVVANNNVSLSLRKGEILALLGENGSGKTTLMNMIAGIYYPDSGSISIDGKEVVIASPRDAFRYRIGMIHQHFKLVDVFSAAENIVLGLEENKRFDLARVNREVRSISETYGFEIDPKKKVYEMSVSEKQTVEIIKVLYRGADILILDEPTNNLDIANQHLTMHSIIDAVKARGMCTLMTMHDINLAVHYSSKFLFIKNGTVFANGGPEIITSDLVWDVYGIDTDVIEHRGMPFVIPSHGHEY